MQRSKENSAPTRGSIKRAVELRTQLTKLDGSFNIISRNTGGLVRPDNYVIINSPAWSGGVMFSRANKLEINLTTQVERGLYKGGTSPFPNIWVNAQKVWVVINKAGVPMLRWSVGTQIGEVWL